MQKILSTFRWVLTCFKQKTYVFVLVSFQDGNGVLDDDELQEFFIRLTQEVVFAQTGKKPHEEDCLVNATELKKTVSRPTFYDEGVAVKT